MIRRPLVTIVTALAIGGITAACGSSSPSTTPATPETPLTAATPAVTTATSVASATTAAPEAPAPATTTPSTGEATVTTFAEQSQDHVETPVSYAESPPIGGEHSKIWQNCGFYSSPIASEKAVHSMEHGAVWITFSPDLPAEQQAELKALADGHSHVLISPFPGLTSPAVGSGWRIQQPFATFDAAAITTFIDTYENGFQTPEPGAPCDGALGDPES